MTEKSSKYIG